MAVEQGRVCKGGDEEKRKENERGMMRRSEIPLPHANTSWGEGGAGGVLHCQEEPQPKGNSEEGFIF